MSKGPLEGLKVIEFASIGPGPHAAMLLADMGAEVLRIDRPGGNGWPNPIVDRGRAVKVLDIRTQSGCSWSRRIAQRADVVIEGLRPGVMERLGLGPDRLCADNPRLIYGRMTGWGQHGPLAKRAGHDINYLAITGALAAMGKPREPAAIPLNLVGDFGGGSLFLVFGILAALWQREKSGLGQVVDAAIVDGVAPLMTFFTGLENTGQISLDRDRNVLSGAAPFYRCYLCRDGREISVGPLEPQFFAALMQQLGLEELTPTQYDESRWGELAGALASKFASQDQAYWIALLAQVDGCIAPVLTAMEAPNHPHSIARGSYVEREGVTQPVPAPRLSRTPGQIGVSADGDSMASRWLA